MTAPQPAPIQAGTALEHDIAPGAVPPRPAPPPRQPRKPDRPHISDGIRPTAEVAREVTRSLALAAAVAVRSHALERRWEEDERPEGSLDLYETLWRDQAITELKQKALAAGLEQEWIDRMEAEVGRERVAEYLRDRLENPMKARLRRAGLLRSDDYYE